MSTDGPRALERFEAAGAGEVLADLEPGLRDVFEPFLDAGDEAGD